MVLSVDFEFDIAQTYINLHPDRSLRQLSSSRLANRRLHVYHSVIAMCVVHPVLLMLILSVVLRIRSRSLTLELNFFHLHTTKHSSFKYTDSPLICHKAGSVSKEMTDLTLAIVKETEVVHHVFELMAFLLIVIRQHLLMSGDVELNPGPLDGE